MEHDPFAVVEAMTICGIATGAERGFIYIRGEYPEAERAIGHAIAQALAAGLLGPNVARSGFAFDIEIRRGGGAYICGEETALFNSIEGKRGEPRSKPPFPAQFGVFGKPTVVNNVETLVNVPDIINEGGAVWAKTGTPGSTGTRLFCLSGHVAKPGLYEIESGRTLARGDRSRRRDPEWPCLAGDPARRRGRYVRRAIGARHAAIVRRRASRRRHARIRRDHGVRRDRRSARYAGRALPSSSSTSHAASACPAASARSGRRNCSAAGIRDRGSGDQVVLAELGQAMRDASICGLGPDGRVGDRVSVCECLEHPSPQARKPASPGRLDMSTEPLWFRLPPRSSVDPAPPPEVEQGDGVDHDRRPHARCSRRHHDHRRLQDARHRDSDAVLSRNADAGERLPRLRRRSRRRARAGAGVLAEGRSRHGDQDALAARRSVAQGGPGVAGIVSRFEHGARLARADERVRGPTGAVRRVCALRLLWPWRLWRSR